jgi:hypothetical protein
MNPDTITTAARMSGGELEGPLKDTFIRLAKLIQAEPDVHRIIAMDQIDDEWHYLIETPFASYPRFVIGKTDDDNQEPTILFQCSAEWSAMEEWQHVIGARMSSLED